MACLHCSMVWLHTHSLTYHVFARVVFLLPAVFVFLGVLLQVLLW